MGAEQSVAGDARLPIIEVSDDGLEAGFRTDAHDEAEHLGIAALAALGIGIPDHTPDSLTEAAADGGEASTNPNAVVVRERLKEYKLEPTVLGEGAFGKVRLATGSDGHQVAVKLIKRDKLAPRTEELLAREVKHHELLRHANIVRLYTWIKTPTKYFLVMEYCPRGDLLGHLEKSGLLSDAEALSLFGQLLRTGGALAPRTRCFCSSASGAAPASAAAGTAKQFPFTVFRSKMGNLPLYIDYRGGGRTKVVTILRKYSGDAEALKTEVMRVCKTQHVNLWHGRMEVKGKHKQALSEWLQECGF